MNGALLRRGVAAWISSSSVTTSARQFHVSPRSLLQRRSSWNDDNNDDDDWGGGNQRTFRRNDNRRSSWGDDIDDEDRNRRIPSRRIPRDNFDGGRNRRRSRNNGNNNRDRGGDWKRNRDDGGWDRKRRNQNNNDRNSWDRNGPNDRNNKGRRGKIEDPASKIDMKTLEAEGFVHLYGLAPILSALKSNQRDFSPRESEEDMIQARFGGDDDDDDYFNGGDDDNAFDSRSEEKKPTKPEAQLTPWLFIQDRAIGGGSGRSSDKVAAAAEVKEVAEELGIPVHYTDKGSLNALSGNRPHQVGETMVSV